jgi:hypothetical protein
VSLIVLVCGGRDFGEPASADGTPRPGWVEESALVRATLDRLHAEGPIRIVEGGAPGADRRAQDWAADRRVPCRTMRADWSRYGKAAGPRRNAEMLAVLVAERDRGADVLVVAFPGGKGTADMVARARRAGLRVVEAR